MKIKTLTLNLTLTLIFLTGLAHAKEDFSAIDDFVITAKEKLAMPSGTAIAIVKDDKIIYQGYFGYADINNKKKVTDQTAFYIASVTKPFFALSALLMEQKGDINKTTTMSQMFPQLKFDEFDADKVTVKHLLSHTTGLSNTPLIYATAYTGMHDAELRHKLVSTTESSKRTNIGEYEYTNMGYNILSVWFDDYYQQDWQKTLSQSVFEPLNMNHTSAYMSDASKKGYEVALPYFYLNEDKEEALSLRKKDNTMHAAGGMISTVTDLARFLIVQLNAGKIDGQQIFDSKIIKKSHQKLASFTKQYRDISRNGYAWGWNIGSYKDQALYHHFGGFAGTYTYLSFMPEQNIGLVVLNNESVISPALTESIADLTYSILLQEGNINSIKKQRMKNMLKGIKKIKKGYMAGNKKRAKRTMVLTQEKSHYSGKYKHPLFGIFEIKLLDSGQFEFIFGNIQGLITAYTLPDTMRMDIAGNGSVIQYKIEENKVEGISVMGYYFDKLNNK